MWNVVLYKDAVLLVLMLFILFETVTHIIIHCCINHPHHIQASLNVAPLNVEYPGYIVLPSPYPHITHTL